MKSPLLKIAKEFVAISGTIEIILSTYIGFLFGSGETLKACVFTAILATLTYFSTRIWILYFDSRVK